MSASLCSQCSSPFDCGANQPSCWCQTRPRLRELNPQTTCLCPRCLDERLQEQGQALEAEIDAELASKTMPFGALGQLQALAKQLALVQQTLKPRITEPTLLLFAGDHGIAHESVSAYPQEVTWQMALNFLHHGAAVSCIAASTQLQVKVIDAGVAYDFFSNPLSASHPQLVHAKQGMGTANFLLQSAMPLKEVEHGLALGAKTVASLSADINLIALGEMGIANTSSAAMLISRLCNLALAQCVGRGTGVNDTQLAHKLSVLERADARHALAKSPKELLAAFGGFEIVQMVGAILEAQRRRLTILVDGFITTAAVIAAIAIEPRVRAHCVFAHQSAELGHRLALEHLGARPLLQLDMRLGEGSGAALAIPLLRAACSVMSDMASFASANVSKS